MKKAINKNKRLSKAGKENKNRPILDEEYKRWCCLKMPPYVKSNHLLYRTVFTKTFQTNTPHLNYRVFNVSYADLTGNEKDSCVKLKMKTTGYSYTDMRVESYHLRIDTQVWGSEMTRDKLCSMVKKWQTTIESNFDFKTTDGFFLRIFWITFSKKKKGQLKKAFYLNSSQIRAIRRFVSRSLMWLTQRVTLEQLVKKEIFLSRAINNMIVQATRNIAPIHSFYIRKIKMLKEKR